MTRASCSFLQRDAQQHHPAEEAREAVEQHRRLPRVQAQADQEVVNVPAVGRAERQVPDPARKIARAVSEIGRPIARIGNRIEIDDAPLSDPWTPITPISRPIRRLPLSPRKMQAGCQL